MSDEIVAFDPGQTTDEDFQDWFAGEAEWQEGSQDAAILDSEGLKALYEELVQVFPPREGPDAPTAAELDANPTLALRVTDYSLSHYLVVAEFPDSQAEGASVLMGQLGAKHGVAIATLGPETVIVRPAPLA
jgi:hypothetical protein